MSIVWRGMTQQELDNAYNQAAYAPNMQDVIARFASKSEGVRERIGPPARYAYGPGANERLDVYSPNSVVAKRPINVFIHGGAWRGGEAKNYAFPAEMFTAAGAHFVPIDFDSVQDHDGDLMPMVEQVSRALAWIGHNAHEFAGDPNQIHMSAHSSGAHLAGVALTTDWQNEFSLPNNFIKSALLCSGMYDMEPVRLSARSAYVRFADESEHALSAIRHLDKITTPVVVAYGSMETPEFQRQSRDFATALQERNHPTELLVGERLNHFEILETLADSQGLLGREALQQMGLVA